MDYKLGFKGQYVAAVELGNAQPTLTISRVVIEKIESMQKDDDGAGKTRDRLVAYFQGEERGWVVNRTNAECMVAMWGRETDKWVGHKVTIFATQVRVGPKMELGIRVKGSPELDKPMSIQVQLPRRKPVPVTLVNTSAPAESK